MSAEHSGEEAPRKGKSNAILTYEEIAAIKSTLTVLVTKLDAMAEDIKDDRAKHLDHEVRLRALEITQAGFTSAIAASKSTGAWIWSAILGVGALAVSLAAYLK